MEAVEDGDRGSLRVVAPEDARGGEALVRRERALAGLDEFREVEGHGADVLGARGVRGGPRGGGGGFFIRGGRRF